MEIGIAFVVGLIFGIAWTDVFIKKDYDDEFFLQNRRIKELEEALLDREIELGYYKKK